MQQHRGAIQAANSIVNALLALNSAVNFAIYCLVGVKFRRILRRRVLRCGRSTDDDGGTAADAPDSIAPAPAASNAIGSGRSSSHAKTTGPAVRPTDDVDCRKDRDCRNGQCVIVVDVSTAMNVAAETACSSPTTPSADELMELPSIDRDHDLDIDLASVVHDDDAVTTVDNDDHTSSHSAAT